MLKKRIIPCLDVQNGQVVKGVNFKNIREVGDPLALAKKYEQAGADELCFLDITATNERRKTAMELAKNLARVLSIPFTIGGGIASVEDARDILRQGADKVAVSSAAVRNPELITKLSKSFGAQAVVLSVDAARVGDQWKVFIAGGQEETDVDAIAWIKSAAIMGAGEILLNSIDHDGMQNGFDIAFLHAAQAVSNLPIIASGGASRIEDFVEVFQKTEATAALAASVFHYGKIDIRQLKAALKENNLAVRI